MGLTEYAQSRCVPERTIRRLGLGQTEQTQSSHGTDRTDGRLGMDQTKQLDSDMGQKNLTQLRYGLDGSYSFQVSAGQNRWATGYGPDQTDSIQI